MDQDNNQINNTEVVRQYAAANTLIRRKECIKNLGLNHVETDSAIATLMNQGFIKKVNRGTYQFVDQAKKKCVPVNVVIWRAMRINKRFTASLIACDAETSVDYVYKLLRKYREDGIIRQIGVQPTHGTGQEKVWMLTLKGQKLSHEPDVKEFIPDPLVMDVVGLNRLICSGLAKRQEAQRQEAIKLCEKVLARLEDDIEI